MDDDYSMGVLQSGIHTRWATRQSTTLETRPRYTSLSFTSFPWPQSGAHERGAVAELAQQLVALRSEMCLARQIGLTQLYNEVDEGAYRALRDVHVRLDRAVAEAYGWPPAVAGDAAEESRRLLELNRAITRGEVDAPLQ
jgi:hypothetical protein